MVRVAIALLLLMVLPAQAEKRVALVIGNSAYQHTPTLINPKNDATDMVAALKMHGFQVLEGFDLDKAAFDRKVRDFAVALSTAQVGVLFYAGHGLQVSGHNYLVPIDAQLFSASALDFEMVRLDLVHRTMEREAQTNILFLDACRDNPLARNLARAMGTRSAEIGRGLAHVESGVGTLISFSTQPGNVALDGTGRNSPFAGALVKQLTSTNDDLFAILVAVRNDVMRETQRKQVPWEHSALTGRFYFSGSPPTSQPPPARLSDAAEAWDRTKDTTSVAVLEAFITRYKDTLYAELARARVEGLKRAAQANDEVAALKEQLAKLDAEVKRQQQTGVGSAKQMAALKDELAKSQAELKMREDEQKKQKAAAATPPPARPAAPPKADPPKSIVATPPPAQPAAPPKGDAPKPTVAVRPMPTRCDGAEALVGNEKRCLKPKDSFKDCDTCPEMVVVPAGEFMMGSPLDEARRESDEGPQHKVTIAKPFAAGKFEATFAEWDACVTAGGCKYRPRDQGWGRGTRPVINVAWDDITKEFMPWLSRKTGKTYRLLTEAEWEYAARAGATTPFSTGRTITTDQANFDGNYTYGGSAKGQYRQRTVEVGSFQANAFGLYDMHGNVWEWVQDCYKDTHAVGPSDGTAASDEPGCRRVVRGGSWHLNPRYLRAAIRGRLAADYRDNFRGFRLARTLSP
jgi:formylglycine-generating enzyme required for sulfatase activity